MGKNVKWKYEPYAFYNKKGIEERLSEMAAEGWFIEKMGLLWKYRKGEPMQRMYNIVYVEEPGTEPKEEKQQEFVEYCEAAGWKRGFTKKGMLIFYHDGENPVPIETEPEFALKNIHKAMKEVYLQRYLSFCILSAVYAFQLWNQWNYRPLQLLSSNFTMFFLAFFVMVLAALVDTSVYYTWRKRAMTVLDDFDYVLPANENKVQRWIADWSGIFYCYA